MWYQYAPREWRFTLEDVLHWVSYTQRNNLLDISVFLYRMDTVTDQESVVLVKLWQTAKRLSIELLL